MAQIIENRVGVGCQSAEQVRLRRGILNALNMTGADIHSKDAATDLIMMHAEEFARQEVRKSLSSKIQKGS